MASPASYAFIRSMAIFVEIDNGISSPEAIVSRSFCNAVVSGIVLRLFTVREGGTV